MRRLAALDQRLAKSLKEHVDDNDALLPHVFMGTITRFIVDRASDTQEGTLVDDVLKALNLAYAQGAEPSRELIVVSFLENLLGTVPLESMRMRLSKDLQAILRRLEEGVPRLGGK